MDKKKTLLMLGLVLVILGIVSFASSHILGGALLVVAIGVLIASVRPGAAERS